MKRLKIRWLFIIFLSYLNNEISLAICPSASFIKSDITTSVSFDNFGDLINGKIINGFSISVTAPDNTCPWDLYIANGVTITQISQYSTQGVLLPLSSINVRAFNLCATPNQEYPFGAGLRPIPAITGNFNPAFSVGGPHYIVGSAAVDGVLMDNNGACSGLVEINDDGTPSLNPTTKLFRYDFQITPGIAAIIQPGLYRLDMNITIADDATGAALLSLLYSLNIEIQPILQLQMNSPSQVDFNFSEIKNFTTGVTKYGATKLNVNSSVNWDLMAIGTSTLNEGSSGATPFWDNSVSYSTGGTVNIPLDVLELSQSPANPAAGQSGLGLDYSLAFTNPPSGNNNIEVAFGSGTSLTAVAPYVLGKTIAGNWGTSGAGNMMSPGSYLTINAAWNRADFSYVINYRLIPGLPVLFPHTQMAAMASYARPGAYTMQVKYLLVEDL
ncbi:MAG: hypothetical protein JNL63_08185 [Bacteroidia bacterium]|nr:hypothetical protein [Bacteroidia bacterium]